MFTENSESGSKQPELDELRAKKNARKHAYYVRKRKENIDEFNARHREYYRVNQVRISAQRSARNKARYRSMDLSEIQKTYVGRLYTRTRLRAKSLGLPFDITRGWLQQKLSAGICEATGAQFEWNAGVGRRPNTPSVDRINPALGYTVSNCRVTTCIFNFAKNEFFDDDVLAMALDLLKKRERNGAALCRPGPRDCASF